MKTIAKTVFIASFLVLALVGLINAGYLAWKHRQKKPLVCPLNANCSEVTESKWAHLFGIRNDTLGIFFFLGLLITLPITFVLPHYATTIYWLIVIGEIVGVLLSIFLLYVQFKIIKAYCFYCIVSAIITFLMFINSLAFI